MTRDFDAIETAINKANEKKGIKRELATTTSPGINNKLRDGSSIPSVDGGVNGGKLKSSVNGLGDYVFHKGTENELAKLFRIEYKTVFYMTLWIKMDGKYISDSHKIKKEIRKYCYGCKISFITEVLGLLELDSPIYDADHMFPIVFKNGVFENGNFKHGDYDYFSPYQIEVNYKPDAESVEIVDYYLNHLTNSDEDYKKLLCEMIGSCLITNWKIKRSLARFFIMIGGGGTGKGTFLSVIESILGTKNRSTLDINDFQNDNGVFEMVGKLANLGDDLLDQPINGLKMKRLKNISTCDAFQAKQLWMDRQTVRITASLIFTSNNQLKTFEKGKQVTRRILWLPMFGKIEKPIPNIMDKLTETKALEYWIKLIVEGAQRILENREYTRSAVVEEENKKYEEENNNVVKWLHDPETSHPDWILGKPVADIYSKYESWCEKQGERPLGKITFSETVRDKLDYTTVQKWENGRNNKIYVKKNF